jgi:hypothetical protein
MHSHPTNIALGEQAIPPAQGYYTIRTSGRNWAVQIVTPCGPKLLRTTVATFPDGEGAIAYAENAGAELRRQFHKAGLAQ